MANSVRITRLTREALGTEDPKVTGVLFSLVCELFGASLPNTDATSAPPEVHPIGPVLDEKH